MKYTSALLLPLLFSSSYASYLCDEFLSKEIPRVVRICGYSDIIPYCCSNKHMEELKNYSDDYQILCDDTPEQKDNIANITSNIQQLEFECNREPDLPDDYTENKKSSSQTITPLSIILLPILFL